MLLISVMFLCYERPWTAVRNTVRGQLGSPVLRLPIRDTILVQRHLGISTPAIAFCHSMPCLLKMMIICLRTPCLQHGSISLRKEHAKSCWIKQMIFGSLRMQAVFTQKSWKTKLRRRENGSLILSPKTPFSLLITSFLVSLQYIVFRIDTDSTTVKPAVNCGTLSVGFGGDWGD